MQELLIISSVVLWVVVLSNVVLTLALIRRINTSTTGQDGRVSVLKIGQQAPAFAAQTLDGTTISLRDYAQRTLALIFVSPNCSHCRDDIPRIDALYPKAQRAGVELVLVSDTELDETQRFAAELGVTMPMLCAPRSRNRFLNDYQIGGFPFFYIVDPSGKVQLAGFPGDPDWNSLEETWQGTPQTPPASLPAQAEPAPLS